tara:strand:- start:527 stop:745 length:219 start_codon:yes stop_codon:yes gene_type:complete
MAKKYKVKDVKATGYNRDLHHERLHGDLILVKKWSKNGVQKCKVEAHDGWEFIVLADNLEEIKTKSNKKEKK